MGENVNDSEAQLFWKNLKTPTATGYQPSQTFTINNAAGGTTVCAGLSAHQTFPLVNAPMSGACVTPYAYDPYQQKSNFIQPGQVHYATSSTITPAKMPRISDEDVERIAKRVVELMRG